MVRLILFVFTVLVGVISTATAAIAGPIITGAVLPTARSIEIGEPATFFVTMVNSGDQTATECRPQIVINDPVRDQVQLRSFPLNDQLELTGDENTRIDIAGGSSRLVLLEITAPAALSDVIPLGFRCNGVSAGYSPSVHDIQLTVLDDGIEADIIAIGLTASNDGIIQISEAGRAGIMSVAATNVGGPGEEGAPPANIRVEPRAGTFTSEFDLTVCELNAASQCISDRAAFLDIQFGVGENRFFGVFARSPVTSSIPLIPDLIRVELLFSDTPTNGETSYLRARTSAAITSPPPQTVGTSPAGIYEFRMSESSADPFYRNGWLYIDTDGSVVGSIRHRQGNWQDSFILPDASIPDAGDDGRARLVTTSRSGRTNVASYDMGTRLIIEPDQRVFGSFGDLSTPSGLSSPQITGFNDRVDFIGAPHPAEYRPDTQLTLAEIAGNYAIIDEEDGTTVGSMTLNGITATVQTTLRGVGPFGSRGTEICHFSLTLQPTSTGRMINIVNGNNVQCQSWGPLRLVGRAAWRPTRGGELEGFHFVLFDDPNIREYSNGFGFFAVPQ